VNGTNDIPTVTSALSDISSEGSASHQLNLLGGAADADVSDILVVTDVTYTVDGAATGHTGADLPLGVTISGHTLTVDPSDSAFDYLAVGEHATIVASYTISDGNGGTVSQTETITVNGTNDLPTVTSALSDISSEGSASHQLNLLGGAADADVSDILAVTGITYTVNGAATGHTGADLPLGVTISGHTLTVDPSDSAFDYLAVGESSIIVASYTVSDGHGGSIAQTETVTVHGVNDAPTVAAALTNSVNEGTASYNLDLLVGAADVDTTDTLSVTAVSYTVDGVATGSVGAALPAGVTLTGSTLTVDPTNTVFDHLAAGESSIIVASYTVSDGHGGNFAQTETVTVHGVNDAPTLILTDNVLTLAANPTSYLIGDGLLVADVDHGDTLTVSLTVGAGSLHITDGNAVLHGSNDTGSLTLQGSATDVQAVLNTLQYTQVGGLDDVLIIDVHDAANAYASDSILLKVGGTQSVNLNSNSLTVAGYSTLSEPIVIESGTKATDVSLAVVGGNLVISSNGHDLTLTGYSGSLTGDKLQFEDGTTLKFNAGAQATLLGTQLADQLVAGSHGDTLMGYGGNDKLVGGDGADRLYGGDGNDLMIGGKGNDYLSGGAGADIFQFMAGDSTNSNGNDIILDFQHGTDHLQLAGVDASNAAFYAAHVTKTSIGNDTLLTLHDGFTGTIRLIGVAAANIDQHDFIAG